MQREEQIRVLRQLMKHIDEGTNVDAGGIRRNPVSAYTCPERAQKEWDRFFRTHPQVVGLSGDLPAPGTFFTGDDFGLPLLATRDDSGRFRAFANVCRHRGALVEQEARGERSTFSCPFHGWTYDTRGELVSVPMPKHFGKIDKACHGLVELPSAERFGLLFVHPERDGTLDTDALLSTLVPEFEAWDFDRLVRVGEDVYETPMNWKLAVDTFGETYHFNTLHRNSLALTFQGNVQCYDTYGRNHRMTLCLKAIQELREKPEADWQVCKGAFPVYFLFPNVQLNVGEQGVILVRIYPIPGTPRRSVSKVSYYLRPAYAPMKDLAYPQMSQTFGAVIRDEDYVAAAISQVGADSGMQDTLVFGRNEPALHHYHNTYREALGMDPLPLLEG